MCPNVKPTKAELSIYYGIVCAVAWIIVSVTEGHLTGHDLGVALRVGLVGGLLTFAAWPLKLRMEARLRSLSSRRTR